MKPLLAACLSLLTLAGAAHAEWTPPENPDPTTILREAQADARARRFEDALAKHLWYHENAEKFDEGQTGVRRSFALSYWYDMGADYAPALAKSKTSAKPLARRCWKRSTRSTSGTPSPTTPR